MQYKYIGQIEIELDGVGLIKPGDVFEAQNINHPLIVKTDEENKKSGKTKK